MTLHKTEINRETKITNRHTPTTKSKIKIESIPVTITSSTIEENVQVKFQWQFTNRPWFVFHSPVFCLRPSTHSAGTQWPLTQPGRGHPLGLSVQFIYQPAQLVESLVWIHVQDGRIKVVAEILLHLAGLFNDLLQHLRLCTGHGHQFKKLQ